MRLARCFDEKDDEGQAALARVLTPAGKYWICKRGPGFGAEAMEVLGGTGYVEEAPLARLYRELPVNSIWEGSGNVMCLDVLRALASSPGRARGAGGGAGAGRRWRTRSSLPIARSCCWRWSRASRRVWRACLVRAHRAGGAGGLAAAPRARLCVDARLSPRGWRRRRAAPMAACPPAPIARPSWRAPCMNSAQQPLQLFLKFQPQQRLRLG